MTSKLFGLPLLDRRQFTGRLGATLSLAACSPLFAQTALSPASANAVNFLNPMNFGAAGDGRTKDTLALQRTLDACAAAGGGTVILPSGHTFLSGTLSLRPHVEFHLEGGATLLASPDRDDFRALGSLLFAKDAADIHVSGTGTWDQRIDLHGDRLPAHEMRFSILSKFVVRTKDQ